MRVQGHKRLSNFPSMKVEKSPSSLWNERMAIPHITSETQMISRMLQWCCGSRLLYWNKGRTWAQIRLKIWFQICWQEDWSKFYLIVVSRFMVKTWIPMKNRSQSLNSEWHYYRHTSTPWKTKQLAPDEDISILSCLFNLTFVFWQKMHYWDKEQRWCLLPFGTTWRNFVLFYFRGERICELREDFLYNYFWDTYFHLRKSHTRKWSPFLINQTIHFIQGPLLFLKANIVDSEVKHNSGIRLPLPLIKSCDGNRAQF